MAITIGMYPFPEGSQWEMQGNPHLYRLVLSIRDCGYVVVPVNIDEILHPEKLKKRNIDILHIHWPGAVVDLFVEGMLYAKNQNKFQKRLINRITAKITSSLLRVCEGWVSGIIEKRIWGWSNRLQNSGVPVVWQIHDLHSHHYTDDDYRRRADRLVHKRLYEIAKGFVVHERSCIEAVEYEYGRCSNVGIATLGSYADVYGDVVAKEMARERLGLGKDLLVMAYVGTARPNRNPAKVAHAFSRIKNGAILIVAGVGVRAYLGDMSKNIVVRDGYLSPDVVRDIFCASDYIINDGEKYLTSAVVRTAMSYGVPVVAYKYGATADMARDASVWIEEESDGVLHAIEAAVKLPRHEWEILHENALRRDSERRWQDGGEACDKVYREIIS